MPRFRKAKSIGVDFDRFAQILLQLLLKFSMAKTATKLASGYSNPERVEQHRLLESNHCFAGLADFKIYCAQRKNARKRNHGSTPIAFFKSGQLIHHKFFQFVNKSKLQVSKAKSGFSDIAFLKRMIASSYMPFSL